MKYKLIATDIDDTLLRKDKTLSPVTKAALLQAQENGVLVAVASGRLPYGVRPYAKELEVFSRGGYYMGFNGGAVMNSKGELIGSAYLDSRYIQPVYDILRPSNATAMVHKGDVIYADDKVNDYTHIESDVIGLPLNVVDDLPSFIDWQIHKFLISGDPDELKDLEQQLLSALGDEVDIYLSAPWFLEVMPKGTNKGTGLQMICDNAGIDISEAVAFGDSFNDIFMLKAAGMGIAMGNAEEAVKAAADKITADCDSDGIALALKELDLI
ncbi:MAG: HAD family phosphatase [Ruminococcus sp.]|nr:HAD family phosphatase [Ruminococcus sp.]